MRRADIARSLPFLAAQTISPPCSTKSEGSACCDSHEFAIRHELPPWHQPQSLRGHLRKRFQSLVALPTDFPRYCPPTPKTREGGVHRYKPITLTASPPSHPK